MHQPSTGAALAAALLLAFAPPALSQSATLLDLRSGPSQTPRFRVDSSGAFVAFGFVKDVGNTTGCAALAPASGLGTRFEWHPCRGSVRFGRVTPGTPTAWDDANQDDFTFAGGNQVVANNYGAFAYGDQVTVSGTVGAGFGSGVLVSGTAGFSAGASNVCSGFSCTAMGYTVRAGGQGSVALGYRVTANNDYTVALGYRATNNGHTGTFVWGDESIVDSVRNQADNEFRIRAAGGVRLRTSAAANSAPGVSGNTGCDLAAGSGTWSCASSRTVKENFEPVDAEGLLAAVRAVPVSSWNYILEGDSVRHVGPMAEDFRAAFGLGENETTIAVTDMAGVTFAGVQALERRTAELEARLVDAERRAAAAETALAQVLERIAALEKKTAP